MNSAQWQRTRRLQLSRQPFCEECRKQGRITAAQCVHHIEPIESAKTKEKMADLAFRMSNLQSLCYDCHHEIHTGSHTKEAHQQRNNDRLEQWKAKHLKNKTNDTE